MKASRWLRACACVGAVVAVSGCGKTEPAMDPTPSVGVTGVTVVPPGVQAIVGDAIQFSASVNADASVPDRTVKWSSSATNVATVDATGKAVARAAGTASIIAVSNLSPSVQGAALLTVSPAPTDISPLLGTYSINATKTIDTGCNFAGTFAGQVQLSGNTDGSSLTVRMIERLTRTYAGSLRSDGAVSATGSGNVNGFGYTGTLTGQITNNSFQGLETMNFTSGCPGQQVVYQFTGSK